MREPSKGLTRELQVGIFIFAACLVIAAFSFRITDTPIFRKGTTLITYLDDATGVFRNSKVKMAGIDIGVIKEITLEGGKARIRMLINQGVEIPENAQVVPRPLGILGDKYLEVVVPAESKKPNKPKESPNGDSTKVTPRREVELWVSNFLVSPAYAQENGKEAVVPAAGTEENNKVDTATTPAASPASGTDEASKKKKKKAENFKEGQTIKALNNPATIDDLTRQMGSVGQDLKAISGTLRQIVESDDQPNSTVGRTLKNAEKLSGNMNSVLSENRKDFREMISSLTRVSQKLEKAMDGFDEKKVKNDIKKLADAVGNVNQSLENVQKITTRIEKGEGTVGKLINDPTIAVELNRTLRSVNLIVDRAARTQTIVDLNSEYNFKPKESKTYVGLSILPKEDVGYIAQLVIDPNGTSKKVITSTVVNHGVETVTEETTNDRSAMRFSLQYYKKLYALSLRMGIFESTGGLGMDFSLFQNSLVIGSELFDFSRLNENPHLKTYARLSFLSYFYASVGGDDWIAKDASRKGFYAGIGMRFVDDDLKVLSLVPSVK